MRSFFPRKGIQLICGTLCLLAGTGFSASTSPSGDTGYGALRDSDPVPEITRRVLAIRVSFQEDDLETTTGDGSFGSAFQFDESWAIDPLPHDSLYFDAQLRFLNHYLLRASNAELGLNWEIWPQGSNAHYQLAYPMWHYHWNESDQRTDEQLAALFADAFALADEDPDLNFFDDAGQARFDHFIIFHAGVGQDFGDDSTPHDIPSAWLGPDLASGALVQVSDASGHLLDIEQGLILPEAENHENFQQALAGLLVLQFGHELGLPNLYDSENGSSVIGRWGLMDQGSGNFRGLLPAPPSAWSRHFLGWDEPLLVESARDSIWVRAERADSALPRTVQVPLSDTEYLLIENKLRLDEGAANHTWARDLAGNWARLDSSYSITFVDTLGNPSDSARTFVEVGNLDFDLPGSGLLIWHVDESRVTPETVANNSVNDEDDRRGVDLEEGDGVQDIGEDYGLFSPRSGLDLGSGLDPWQYGNPGWEQFNRHYSVNDVTFAWDTRPSTNTNDGLVTGLRLRGFSDPGDSAHFDLSWDFRPAEHLRSLLPADRVLPELGSHLQLFSWQGAETAALHLLDTDGRSYSSMLTGEVELYPRADGGHSLLPVDWQDGLSGLAQDDEHLLAWRGDSLANFRAIGIPTRFVEDFSRSLEQTISAVLPLETESGKRLFAIAGNVLLELDPLTLEPYPVPLGQLAPGLHKLVDVRDGSGMPGIQVEGEFRRVYLAGRSLFASVDAVPAGATLFGWDDGSLRENAVTAILRDTNGASLYHDSTLVRRINCANEALRPVQYGPDAGYELAFLKSDGSIRILNQSGVELGQSPALEGGSASWLTGSRLDAQGQDGLSHLLHKGQALHGLASDGTELASWPRILPKIVDGLVGQPELGRVYGVTHTGKIHAWEVELGNWIWTQPRGDANGSMRAWGFGQSDEILPPVLERNPAYVWPNPAAELAHFHFYLESAASVELRIYDSAGDLRYTDRQEFHNRGEHELLWNTGSEAPGPYFCLLKATASDGGSASWTRKIKCAVIR